MRSRDGKVSIETFREHYMVLVGEVCELARAGGLAVEVTTRGGRRIRGVPEPRPVNPDDPDEVDDTGFANDLTVDGEVVGLVEVTEIRIPAPGI